MMVVVRVVRAAPGAGWPADGGNLGPEDAGIQIIKLYPTTSYISQYKNT